MNMLKTSFLLITGSLISAAVLSQSAPLVSENDIKTAVVKPSTSTIPAPGTKVVTPTPPEYLQPGKQENPNNIESPQAAMAAPSPLTATDNITDNDIIKPGKHEVPVSPTEEARKAKIMEEMKVTDPGKKVRPKTIDRATGQSESKLAPVKPGKAKPVFLAPEKEN